MSVGVPKKESSYQQMGKNIRSPSTEPHADGRLTYNEVRPEYPRHTHTHTKAQAMLLPEACVCLL